jgi:lipopolysaccharide assembly outer membrane protein LptD (OstA)
MKKIILVLLINIFFLSAVSAKTIIFKECYYVSDSKFDPKIYEKLEFIVDTKLSVAKKVRVYTDFGLAAETERVKNIKELKGYRPEKIDVSNLTIEYLDNKYAKLKFQRGASTDYTTYNLNLEKKIIEQTHFFDNKPVHTFLAYTCSGSSNNSTGTKDTLKKIIGK